MGDTKSEEEVRSRERGGRGGGEWVRYCQGLSYRIGIMGM